MVPQNNEELRNLLTNNGARPGTEATDVNRRKDKEEAPAIQRGMAARSVIISKPNQQTAIRTLQGLEASGALRPGENGQSNAEIYLQHLILVNQMEGPESPARKALNCLFDRDGNPRTDLSPEDIKTIQAGVEYSIQHTRTTRSERGTVISDKGDYEAKTETRTVPSAEQPDASRTLGQNAERPPEGPTTPRTNNNRVER